MRRLLSQADGARCTRFYGWGRSTRRSTPDGTIRIVLVIAYLSVVYAAMFPIYLSRLHYLLHGESGRPRVLGSLVLTGGVLFVALHAVSDVGITGLLGAKLASCGFQHDPGVSYTLYLVTFALDSVGDVFGSLFAFAAGLLVIGSAVLPRWLGWVSILVGILFFLQGFGLGGVIATLASSWTASGSCSC